MSDEPVMTVEWWKTSISSLVLVVAGVSAGMGWWRPTADQIAAFSSAAVAVVAIVYPIVAFYVRSKVTPVEPPV
jgi:hypothetical protein